MKSTRFRLFALGLTPILVIVALACSRPRPPLVILFCLDGATPGIIDDLRAEGQLPTFDGIIRGGASGPLESIQSLPVSEAYPKKGYFSPVIWASIASGKSPEKHGILDFQLPRPGTSFAWAGGSGSAAVQLPELAGSAPFQLRLRIRSYEGNGPQTVQVEWNQRSLGSLEAPTTWKDFSLDLPSEALRPIRNQLRLIFSQQRTPASLGQSQDQRPLAGALALIQVLDSRQAEVARVEPIFDRFSLGEGFYPPEAQMIDTQSVHWKARPIWQILGQHGIASGIIGYWATWPAQSMNGFLVSSHMGLRGRKRKTKLPRLTWPEELADQLQGLAPTDAELNTILRQFYPADCMPSQPDKLRTFEEVVWQDEFFYRIAQKTLPTLSSGLFSVYFESMDVGSHSFLPLYDGLPIPAGCPETARAIVPRVYEQVDRWMGQLLQLAPKNAWIVVVSDHGLVTFGSKGEHHPYGIFAASGPHIPPGTRLQGASALDVAPTLLHLFEQPIPLDMDGKLLVQIFEKGWLDQKPPRYAPPEAAVVQTEEARTEATGEMLEKLKGIGYLQ